MSAKRDRITEEIRRTTTIARKESPPPLKFKVGKMKPGHHTRQAYSEAQRAGRY